MVNYQDGKIYKLVGGGKTYIGSTTQRLSKRKSEHKKKNHMCMSKEIINEPDCDIILIEKYPCECKEELHSRERYWIENTECINKIIPLRTKKEYYEDNKEKIKAQAKEYREHNRDKINKINKEKYKAYYQENKDKIKARRKAYYERIKAEKQKADLEKDVI